MTFDYEQHYTKDARTGSLTREQMEEEVMRLCISLLLKGLSSSLKRR